jgi:hypothetical protein
MRRLFAFGLLAAVAAVAACQPSKSPEELAAERNAAALKEVLGDSTNPEQVAAALAQAGALAAAADPNMSAEDRAKLNAITGAIASGQVHPAASAYVAGLDKVFVVISTVKDDATANAAKPKLQAIYAEMAGPAAQLKAMSENDREVAFGSAYAQFMSFGMKMAGVMMPLASNPDLADKVGDLLEGMPEPE